MKTFKNIKVGVLETVNDELAKQYMTHSDVYEYVSKKSKAISKETIDGKEQS